MHESGDEGLGLRVFAIYDPFLWYLEAQILASRTTRVAFLHRTSVH